jgi:hypothetical protein
VYNWSKDEDHFLPEHYKQRCEDFMRKKPKPVHFTPVDSRWKLDETGNVR